MSFFGDLAFIIGTIGVIIYICLIVIRYTSRSAQFKTAIQRYEGQIGRLQERIAELKEQEEGIGPEVDSLVDRMIKLREIRDKLHFRYEDMVDRSRQREIDIRYNAR